MTEELIAKLILTNGLALMVLLLVYFLAVPERKIRVNQALVAGMWALTATLAVLATALIWI